MRFLAFGDLHLGAGTSLGRSPGDRLSDQCAVLERIVELTGEHEVDAVLMAGDLFDGPTITPEQLDVFIRCFEPIFGLPVIAISGNGRHDLATRGVNALEPLRHLPGLVVCSRPWLVDLGSVQIAAMPWVSPARLIANHGETVDRERLVERAQELLVDVAHDLHNQAVANGDKPAVLMLHGSLSGASIPTGLSTDQLGAVIDTDALIDLGFSAIVAAHIHVPQFTGRERGWYEAEPGRRTFEDAAALYTGSPMPLNFGETNVPHGVWILDVGENGARAEFVPIDSRPLVQVDLMPGDGDHGVLWPEMWAGELEGAIVKAKLTCTQEQRRRIDPNAIRHTLLDAGAHTVKIEVDTVREERSRVDAVTDELAPLDAFDAYVDANDLDRTVAAAGREQMQRDLEAVA